MTHLAEGALLTLRDAQPLDVAAREHLDGCAGCRALLQGARDREALVHEALGRLDEAFDPERARAAVRARLEQGPWKAQPRAPTFWTRDLRRAAAILLLTAGAVSALPGSPVRRWLTESASSPAPATAATEAQVFAEREAGGVTVPVPEEGLRVLILGASAGTEIEVVWVDDASARLVASSGSGFTYGEGRLEAVVTEGPVHVELPRGTSALTLMVAGDVYLARTGGRLEVPGPVQERSEERIVFAVGAP